ncbi:MAG: MarR family winged helix-turn-helix transcriptional regulator [Acidobacteriota bacterium]
MFKEQDFLGLLFEVTKAVRFCNQENICGEDITFQQFMILNQIAQNGSMRMSDLHEVLAVEKSTTTRLIEPLVKKELMVKEKCCADSRVIDLRLTPEGQAMRDRAWDCLQGFIANVDSMIPKEKRHEVYESVKLYVGALRANCAEENCCQTTGGGCCG